MAHANTEPQDSLKNAERADPEHAGVGHPEPGPRYEDHKDDDGIHHVPVAIYYKVFAALMVLLFLTWLAAQYEFGIWNIPIALAIAVTKAVLVIMFFMHVKFSSRLVAIFVITPFLFVLILFGFTMADYMTRHLFGLTP